MSGSNSAWLFLALFAIVLAPFALCSPLPLADFPNHLARIYIIANLEHSADLAKYYSLNWAFVPNLAMDLLVPPLIPALSPETGMTLFAALALFLTASGPIVLNRALYGRWSLVPFVGFLFLYNRQFLWGILNYLFTVGLSFWIFAAHIYMRDRSSAITRMVLFSLLSVVLLVCHLHAFASYAILVGCYEISIAWRTWRQSGVFQWRALFIPAVQFVAPVFIFLSQSSTVKRAGDTYWISINSKINGLVEVFNNYNIPFDIASFLVMAGLFALGIYTKRLTIHRDMRLSIILLFIIFLAMPEVMFSSMLADRRLLVLVWFVLAASLDLRLESARIRTALICGLGALFLARMALLAVNWHEAQRIYNPALSAIDHLAPGSRLAFIAAASEAPSLPNPPIDHLGNMAVLRKNVYINSLFAEPGQQVLRLKYNAGTKFSISPSQTFRFKEREIGHINPFETIPLERFDYVMIINEEFFDKARPAQLKQTFHEGAVTLYKVSGNGQSGPDPR